MQKADISGICSILMTKNTKGKLFYKFFISVLFYNEGINLRFWVLSFEETLSPKSKRRDDEC
jgi:hypothetical protein